MGLQSLQLSQRGVFKVSLRCKLAAARKVKKKANLRIPGTGIIAVCEDELLWPTGRVGNGRLSYVYHVAVRFSPIMIVESLTPGGIG